MPKPRKDLTAVQLRLTPEEVARFDAMVLDRIISAGIGGSGITRTSLLRDMLLAELKKHEASR